MKVVSGKEIAAELGVEEALLSDLRRSAGLPMNSTGDYILAEVRQWRASLNDGGEGGGGYLKELLLLRKKSAF